MLKRGCLFLYPKLASVLICNQTSTVLNMGKWDMLEHLRVLL